MSRVRIPIWYKGLDLEVLAYVDDADDYFQLDQVQVFAGYDKDNQRKFLNVTEVFTADAIVDMEYEAREIYNAPAEE